MRGFLTNVLSIIGIGIVVLFIWKVWGETGRLGELLDLIWNFFYGFWDAGANILVDIFKV